MEKYTWLPRFLLISVGVTFFVVLFVFNKYDYFTEPKKPIVSIPIITTAQIGSTTQEILEINKRDNTTYDPFWVRQQGILDRAPVESLNFETQDKKVVFSRGILNCNLNSATSTLDENITSQIREDISGGHFRIIEESEPYIDNTNNGRLFAKDFLIEINGYVYDILDLNDRLANFKKILYESEYSCDLELNSSSKTNDNTYFLYEREDYLEPKVIYMGEDRTGIVSYSDKEGAKTLINFNNSTSTWLSIEGDTIFVNDDTRLGILEKSGSINYFLNLDFIKPFSEIKSKFRIDENHILVSAIKEGNPNFWEGITSFYLIDLTTNGVEKILEENHPLYTDSVIDENGYFPVYFVGEKDCGGGIEFMLNPLTKSKIEKYVGFYDYYDMNSKIMSPNSKNIALVLEHPDGSEYGDMCSGGKSTGILNLTIKGSSQLLNIENNPKYTIQFIGWSSDSRYFIYSISEGSYYLGTGESTWVLNSYRAYDFLNKRKLIAPTLQKLTELMNENSNENRYGVFKIDDSTYLHNQSTTNRYSYSRDVFLLDVLDFPNSYEYDEFEGMIGVRSFIGPIYESIYLEYNK